MRKLKYDEVYVTIFVIAAIVGAVFSIMNNETFFVAVFVAIILGLFMASVVGIAIVIPILEMLGLMEE